MKFYGFWLILEEESEKEISEIIEKLGQKYSEGKVFIPHLSAYPSIQMELSEIISNLTQLFTGFEPFVVETDGIGMESRWSKTLYIKVKNDKNLSYINSAIDSKFSKVLSEENSYSPHISLLYNLELSDATKQEEATKLTIPKQLKIKSLGIIDPGVEDSNWRDFSKWKVVEEILFMNQIK